MERDVILRFGKDRNQKTELRAVLPTSRKHGVAKWRNPEIKSPNGMIRAGVLVAVTTLRIKAEVGGKDTGSLGKTAVITKKGLERWWN